MRTVLIIPVYLSAFFVSGQGCTIHFKNDGSFLREDSYYWSTTGYANQGTCEAVCLADDLCAAYSYDSSDGKCRKSHSTEMEEEDYCPTCSFTHKECGTDCPITYQSVGPDKTCEDHYVTIYNIDLATCQSNCSAAQSCMSFCYDSSLQTCSFSVTNKADSESCPSCTHHKKNCNFNLVVTTSSSIEDLTTETITDTSLEQDSPISSSSIISTTNNVNTSPSSFDVDVATLSDTAAASTFTNDVKNVTLSTTGPLETTAVQTNPTTSGPLETTVVQTMPTTSGPSETTAEQTLPVTGADTTTAISTSTVFEYSTMVQTTTSGNETWSSVSAISPMLTNVNNSSTSCFCQCYYDNETTIRERMEARQKYLKVNIKELSSFKRSRVCASDPRYSSKVTGSLGIFVFTLIVLLVTVPDLSRAAGCVIRKFNIYSNIFKHKSTSDKTS